MTSSPLSLSLRPSPSNEAASAEQLTLADVLARITAEYGPTFANVTEDKLQEEINKQTAGDVDMEDVDGKQDSNKHISREELVRMVQYVSTFYGADLRTAFEESSLAQDFISLLLSSARPAAAGASMSPTLKNAVPAASLGGSRIFPQQPAKLDLSISIGWKKAALESTSQTLIAAADRIAQNSGETGQFVDGVLKIRAAGWGITQIPAGAGDVQNSTLRVCYGFQKAGSDYHDPGNGYLKESFSGELVFSRDPRFADKKERISRIRIEDKDGFITTSFAGPKDYSQSGLTDVEVQLMKARDFLFDEELYHELTKEARVMSNSGVVITESEIRVPLADGSKGLIDLIDPETTESSEVSLLARGVLLALHSLLSHAHHLNLKKRQEIPEPLSTRKPQVRPMLLLRPLVAFNIHKHLLGLAEIYFKSLLEPFKAANLPCSLEINRCSNLENITNSTSAPELLETLLTTAQSTLTLYLPADSSLSLQIQTPFQHSQTTYQWIPPFTLKTSSLSSADGEISFDALSDAESPIMLAVEESLALATLDFLGPEWRKIELREFERNGHRIRVELRGSDHAGRIMVINGTEEMECTTTQPLQQILAGIADTV